MNDEAHGGMTLERPRPAMLPMAMMLILGLMLGFAAGYIVAERSPAAEEQAAASPASPAAPPASPQPQRSGQAQPQRSGRAYSEQIVRQPSATPPVPGDAPGADSARPARPRGAVPGTGQMIVQSTPPRAGVTVNGDWRGRTPLTLTGLKFGSYVVRIVQPGFVTAREEVTLSAAQPSRTVSARLQRAVGTAAVGTRRRAIGVGRIDLRGFTAARRARRARRPGRRHDPGADSRRADRDTCRQAGAARPPHLVEEHAAWPQEERRR